MDRTSSDIESKLELFSGQSAVQWIASAENIREWDSLYDECPWSNPFLSSQFARVFLKHYGSEWEPILVCLRDAHKILRGIAPFVRRRTVISGMGAHQAEYHGWLYMGPCSWEFPLRIFLALRTEFVGCTVHLKFLSPGIPPADLAPLRHALGNHLILTGHERPLLRTNAKSVADALVKKGTRSKLNRLKRMGELRYENRLNVEEFAENLEPFIRMYDFRQGAVHDSMPFAEDARKRAFYLDWAKAQSSFLQMSGLYLNDILIAGVIGAASRGCMHLLMLGYAPWLASASPGKLIIYRTAEANAIKGLDLLDLTPGGKSWKGRFASEFDNVMELEFLLSSIARRVILLRGTGRRFVKRLLTAARIDVKSLGAKVSKVRRFALTEWLRSRLAGWSGAHVYTLSSAECLRDGSHTSAAHIDNLAQFIGYALRLPVPARHRFLLAALTRLEDGEHCYAIARNGVAACFGWALDCGEYRPLWEMRSAVHCADRDMVLHGFQSDSANINVETYKDLLTLMLKDIHDHGAAKTAHVVVPSRDQALREAAESLGFSCVGTIPGRRFGTGWPP